MFLKIAVRSHFESNANLEYFPFMRELEEQAESEGISAKRFYFKLLGYKDGDGFGAEEIYEMRKAYAEGNTKQLEKKLKISENKDIKQVLTSVKALPKKGSLKKPKAPKNIKEDLVRILGDYFRFNEERLISVGGSNILLSAYIKNFSLSREKKELLAALDSAQFKNIAMTNSPTFIYSEGRVPVITSGNFYVNARPSKQMQYNLVSEALRHAVIRSLDIPEDLYFFITSACTAFELMEDDKYLDLLDWSFSLGKTVKELVNLCGLEFVDRLHYAVNHKVIPIKVSGDNYMMYLRGSDKPLVMKESEIKRLINNQALETLGWDEEGPFVYMGAKIYLRG